MRQRSPWPGSGRPSTGSPVAPRAQRAGNSSGGAAGRAANAATEAGNAIAAAGETAARGWDAVADSLQGYADSAMETGRQIGDALVSAFRGAEDALLTLVTKGKVDFRDLANSILEDITRIALRSAVLGPLANWLGGALGGIGAVSVWEAASPRRWRIRAA